MGHRHGSRQLERTIAYISSAHPFWNRTQGADHVFFLSLDRGACHLPRGHPAARAIKLVHFGYTHSGEQGPLGRWVGCCACDVMNYSN